MGTVLPWAVAAVLLRVPAGAAVLSWQLEARQMIVGQLGKLLLSHSFSLFFTVAILTARIRTLEEHLQRHPKVTQGSEST